MSLECNKTVFRSGDCVFSGKTMLLERKIVVFGAAKKQEWRKIELAIRFIIYFNGLMVQSLNRLIALYYVYISKRLLLLWWCWCLLGGGLSPPTPLKGVQPKSPPPHQEHTAAKD